jgi:hypothetical protein
VLARLKEDGFTHILIADSATREKKVGIRRWVSPNTRNERLPVSRRFTFTERSGRKVEYVLLNLK